MTTQQFRDAMRTRPFRPFVVHLADGDAFEVRHPEMAWQTEAGRTIFINTGGDKVEIIDLLLVTRLSSGNGSTRRKTRRK